MWLLRAEAESSESCQSCGRWAVGGAYYLLLNVNRNELQNTTSSTFIRAPFKLFTFITYINIFNSKFPLSGQGCPLQLIAHGCHCAVIKTSRMKPKIKLLLPALLFCHKINDYYGNRPATTSVH